MGLSRLTTSAPPLSLDDLRSHLRIDSGNDDALLSAYLAAAVQYVEDQTRQVLAPATFRLTLDGFPNVPAINLPGVPLTDVDTLEYLTPDGDVCVMSPSLYTVDVTSKPGRLILDSGAWPATNGRPGCVTVEYSAGHAAGTLPPTLAAAVRLYVGLLYEQREAASDRTVTEVPLALKSLLQMQTYAEAV